MLKYISTLGNGISSLSNDIEFRLEIFVGFLVGCVQLGRYQYSMGLLFQGESAGGRAPAGTAD